MKFVRADVPGKDDSTDFFVLRWQGASVWMGCLHLVRRRRDGMGDWESFFARSRERDVEWKV